MEKRLGRVCLDTNVVIDYLRQTKETEGLIEKLHLRFDEVALTAITVYELLLGVEYLGGKDRPEVDAMIKSSVILPLSEETSREAAKVSAELRRAGQHIGIADELIAAICITFDACLLTGNIDHFRRIGSLQIMELKQL